MTQMELEEILGENLGDFRARVDAYFALKLIEDDHRNRIRERKRRLQRKRALLYVVPGIVVLLVLFMLSYLT